MNAAVDEFGAAAPQQEPAPTQAPAQVLTPVPVATLDEALTTTERAGFRAFEAELHRVRGEILLKRDPANPAPAQEALQSAIAIARRRIKAGGDVKAALAILPITKPLFARYRAMIEADYPHLEI